MLTSQEKGSVGEEWVTYHVDKIISSWESKH